MKIAILYESSERQGAALCKAAVRQCSAAGNESVLIDASEEELKACIGCFSCWVKTPGTCIHTKDGGQKFLRNIFDADYFLIISGITWGGYSTGIKYYADRMLPLLHPYFRKLNGEMHHRLRYDKIPLLLTAGFTAGNVENSADEEKTFRKFTEANRDNTGGSLSSLTYVDNSGTVENKLSNFTEWLSKETGI